ncbi:MAG: hypothetical protein V4665_04260 [Patescibacteria group bacterium]
MTKEQAGGYIFEAAIWELLKKSGYITVKGDKLRGRGSEHQIDAVGYWKIPIPFVFPVRLMLEGKFKETTDLSSVRSFLGAHIDIKENYFVRGKSRPSRYTDVACICCKGSFTQPAQDYAWAHNIFLVSFRGVQSLRGIIENIEQFLNEANLEVSREDLILSFQNQSGVVNQNLILIVGMLDGKYPIMLSADKEFTKFLERRSLETGDVLRAVKTERFTGESETVYRIGFIENERIPVEFSLPNGIATKLSRHIDQTHYGRKIFDIEIPSVQSSKGKETRRIFKLNVILG